MQVYTAEPRVDVSPFFSSSQLTEEFKKMGNPNKLQMGEHSLSTSANNTGKGTGPHLLLLSLYCILPDTPIQKAQQETSTIQ